MKPRLLISLVAVLCIVLFIIYSSSSSKVDKPDSTSTDLIFSYQEGEDYSNIASDKQNASTSSSEEPFRALRYEQDLSKLANDPREEGLTEMAQNIENPALSEEERVINIDRLLFSLIKFANVGELPTCDNVHITNALLGDNKRKIAYMLASSNRINEHGELVDRWGTPYHFHFVGDDGANVRSAGLDKLHYTDDDFVSRPDEEPQ